MAPFHCAVVRSPTRPCPEELTSAYGDHLASLRLTAMGYGRLTARNLYECLVRTHLEPSADKYLAALSDTDRET
jgi:hypothetical protein